MLALYVCMVWCVVHRVLCMVCCGMYVWYDVYDMVGAVWCAVMLCRVYSVVSIVWYV